MPKHTFAINRVSRPERPTLVQVLRPVEPVAEVRLELSRKQIEIVHGRLALVREIDQ